MQAAISERFTGTPAQPGESRLNISVVFTSEPETLRALKTAASLAASLGGRITLVVPEVVSYQLPLNEPPVKQEWMEKRFSEFVSRTPVETAVRFYLCRDRDQTLARVLKPHSLVVIGGRSRWWPTPETRLARRLRRLGHEVILAETE
jgi:hypothetical protein